MTDTATAHADTTTATARLPERPSPSLRRALLTSHIILSVGLLGDCAAVLAVNIRTATTADPEFAKASYELLGMFSLIFGIPLSFGSLISGVSLGLGTKWGSCATAG